MSGYYGSRQSKRVRVPWTGRVGRANKFAGPCHYCGTEIAAGAGQLYRHEGDWKVVHLAAVWHGSPVSGKYIHGCPGEADKLNTPVTASQS